MRKNLLIFLFVTLCSAVLFAQNEEVESELSMESLLELSLEELMDIQVSVSTKSSLSIRETPGIVSVITKEDIERSGARDMIDLLQRFVPGFDFGSDVEGMVGLSVRGLWSYEGKVLLLIDGMEANELMFGTSTFGNHYPLENVERIEIVRGPGSVIYGGYATMGVINIITKRSDRTTGSVSYLASHTGKSFSHNNMSFFSNFVENDLQLSFYGDYGNGTRSDRLLRGVMGDSRTMQGNSGLRVRRSGVQLNYKKLNINAVMIDYCAQTIDLWDSIYQGRAFNSQFSDFLSQASYEFNISDGITITPHVSYKWQRPWNLNTPSLEYANNKTANKTVAGVMGNYKKGMLNFLLGFDYNYETLNQPLFIEPYAEIFKDSSDMISYHNFDVYAQAGLNTKFGNITAGARFDKSTLFGQMLVPRIAITKAFEKFHIKAAVNKAFRAPGGILPNRQYDGADPIKPEDVLTYELETGVKLPAKFYFTLNLFNTDFKKIIVYEVQPSGIGTYKNAGNIGTMGAEVSLRHSSRYVNSELNIAYYQRKKSDGDTLQYVPLDEKHFLGSAPIKVNAVVSVKLTDHLRITPSVSFFGRRYAYLSFNHVTNVLELEEIKPTTLLNANISYSDFPLRGFMLSVGVNNILNQDFRFYSGSKSAHSPLPGLDRSIQFKITYQY